MADSDDSYASEGDSPPSYDLLSAFGAGNLGASASNSAAAASAGATAETQPFMDTRTLEPPIAYRVEGNIPEITRLAYDTQADCLYVASYPVRVNEGDADSDASDGADSDGYPPPQPQRHVPATGDAFDQRLVVHRMAATRSGAGAARAEAVVRLQRPTRPPKSTRHPDPTPTVTCIVATVGGGVLVGDSTDSQIYWQGTMQVLRMHFPSPAAVATVARMGADVAKRPADVIAECDAPARLFPTPAPDNTTFLAAGVDSTRKSAVINVYTYVPARRAFHEALVHAFSVPVHLHPARRSHREYYRRQTRYLGYLHHRDGSMDVIFGVTSSAEFGGADETLEIHTAHVFADVTALREARGLPARFRFQVPQDYSYTDMVQCGVGSSLVAAFDSDGEGIVHFHDMDSGRVVRLWRPPPIIARVPVRAEEHHVHDTCWGAGVLHVAYGVFASERPSQRRLKGANPDYQFLARLMVTPVTWQHALSHRLAPPELVAALRTIFYLRWRGDREANVGIESKAVGSSVTSTSEHSKDAVITNAMKGKTEMATEQEQTPTAAVVSPYTGWSDLPLELFEQVVETAWRDHMLRRVLIPTA